MRRAAGFPLIATTNGCTSQLARAKTKRAAILMQDDGPPALRACHEASKPRTAHAFSVNAR